MSDIWDGVNASATDLQVPNLPILYSFRRCPYAMRARMSISSAALRCELREVVLRDKPAEMIAISPKGTVPVLALSDGTVIEESLDIMLWALAQRDPENWLNPAGASRDDAFALIEQTEAQFKPHLDRYKYPDRYTNANTSEHRDSAVEFVRVLEQRLSLTPYLFGGRACIADIAIFPFLRQFAHVDLDWFEASPYEHTRAWLAQLCGSTHFEVAMKKYAQWKNGDEVVVFPQ